MLNSKLTLLSSYDYKPSKCPMTLDSSLTFIPYALHLRFGMLGPNLVTIRDRYIIYVKEAYTK